MASAANTTYVQILYQTVLFRSGSTSDVNAWATLLDSGLLTQAQEVTAFETSVEAVTYVDPLVRLYQAAFNRAPDAAGVAGWVTALENGSWTLAQVSSFFTTSPEFTAKYGVYSNTNATNTAFVTALYANVLGRAPDPDSQVWVNLLNAGTLTEGQVLMGFSNSPEFIKNSTIPINNWLTAANTAAEAGATSPYGTTIPGIVPIATGIVFQLTTGQDIATANTFEAVLDANPGLTDLTTLQGFDQLTGAGTANTLNIIDGSLGVHSDVLPLGATFTNIQSLTLTTSNNAGGATTSLFDTTGVSGLTSLTVNSSGTNGDYIKAASSTNVTEIHQTTGAGEVYIIGGNNITVTDHGSGADVYVGGSSVTVAKAPAGAVTVIELGSNTVYVDGGTTASVTDSGTGDVTVGKYLAPSGAVTITDTGGNGDINVYGGASASITVNTTSLANGLLHDNNVYVTGVTGAIGINKSTVEVSEDIDVKGGGGGAGVTINTTGGDVDVYGTPSTGNVTITDTNAGSNDTIYAFGTASVTITTTATSGGISIGKSTAANDPTGTAAIVNQTVTGSGTYYGTGFDYVYTNGATAASIVGGSKDYVFDEAATNVLSSVTLTGVTGNAYIHSTALTSLTIANNTKLDPLNVALGLTDVTVYNTAAENSTLAVTLSGDTNSGVYVEDDHAATITVTATGTGKNNIGLHTSDVPAASAPVTVSFTNNSTDTLKVTYVYTNALTKVTVAGSGAVNLGDTTAWGTEPTSIADTGSGVLTATIDGQFTKLTGGSGANVVTVNSTGTLTQSINGGSGGNNTVILTNVAADYAGSLGAGLSNFQNVLLGGTQASGTYDATVFTGSVGNTGSGEHNVGFTNVAPGETFNVFNSANYSTGGGGTIANATNIFAVATTAANGDTFSVGVNGVTITGTFTAAQVASTTTEAAAIAAAINGVFLGGIATNAYVNTTTGASTPGAIVYLNADLTGTISTSGTGTFTTSAGTGTTETIDSPAGVISETLATITGVGNTLPLTVNSATGVIAVNAVVSEANNQTIAINSVKDLNNHTNVVTIADTTATVDANNATKIVVTGAGKLTLDYVDTGTLTDALATIDASASSGSVNVASVMGSTHGMTITGGSGSLTAWGSGLWGSNVSSGIGGYAGGENPASYLTASDTITTGSGGGTVVIGYAGAGGSAGSTTVNLAASTAKADTVKAGADTTYGVRATVSGFTASASSATADKVTFTATKAAIATNTTPGVTTAWAGVDTFTVANGVIAFTGSDTTGQMILDAIGIVDGAGTNKAAAFTAAGNTYVVASGATANSTHADVITLSGVTGVTQLGGITAATGNILGAATGTTGSVTGAAATADGGGVTITQDDTGYSIQSLSAVGTAGTHTFNNLAASAIVNSAATGTFNLTTTQAGTAGSESLTVNLTAGQTLTTASFTGDNALVINPSGGVSIIITTLANPGNTLAKITIGGSQTLDIGAITDTALTAIAINDTAPVFLGGSSAPLAQAGLTVTIGPATPGSAFFAFAEHIYLSGAGATIDISAATATAVQPLLSATGANSTIKGGLGKETIIGGVNATVTLPQGSTTGSLQLDGNGSPDAIHVGSNSTVTLGTDHNGAAFDGGSTISVFNSLGVSDVTGANSSGNYTLVTLNHVVDGATGIQFYASGASHENLGGSNFNFGHALVNVASATTLGGALDIAAAREDGGASTHSYDWFQWAGNDYVVAHSGVTGTALSATDVVVKIVGLVDLSNFHTNGAAGVTL